MRRLGYNVSVLKYRVGAHKGDKRGGKSDRIRRASDDMARAMSLIEQRAVEWCVDTTTYSVWGSSAGGRLAMQWGSDSPMGAVARGFRKPTVVVAAYPAVEKSTDHPMAAFPPCFITAAQDDTVVSVSQIDALVRDLRSAGAEVDYQKVNSGGHGYGLGVGTDVEGWFAKVVTFWEHHRGR